MSRISGVRRLATNGYYAMKTAVLLPLRGGSSVIWTPDHGLGFGNLLYLLLQAHAREDGTRVLLTDPLRPWLETFPELRELVVERSTVSWRSPREWNATPRLYQRFGTDYSITNLDTFVGKYLRPYIPLHRHRLVVNVRRGDYYTTYREKYAMDVAGYVREALRRCSGVAPLIVSDEPEWCRKNLSLSDAIFARVDPVSNFFAVATADCLVGTNSTFSYWGGYVSGGRVIVPAFHSRDLPDGRADQLDPRWEAIDGYDLSR